MVWMDKNIQMVLSSMLAIVDYTLANSDISEHWLYIFKVFIFSIKVFCGNVVFFMVCYHVCLYHSFLLIHNFQCLCFQLELLIMNVLCDLAMTC